MQEKTKKGQNIILYRIIVVIVAVIVLMFLLQKLGNILVDKITTTISRQYSQELNTQMSAHILSTLEHFFDDMEMIDNTLLLVDNLDEQKLESFITKTQKDNKIPYLAFVDENGYIYESTRSYLGTTRVRILGKLLNGNKNLISDNETVGNQNYILLGTALDTPIRMGDKHICAALLGLSNDELDKEIILESQYSGSYSSIIHTNGRYIMKNPLEAHNGLNVFAILDKSYDTTDAELTALKQAVKSGDSYILDVTRLEDKTLLYLYFAPIAGTDWYAVNTLPGSFIRSNVEELQMGLSKYFFIIIAVVSVAAGITIFVLTSSKQKLHKSQEELAKALKLAEEASNAKTSFLFSMSHDIRTPMNAILGYTDIAIRHFEDTDEVQDSLKKIKTSGEHLLSLINDILEMSRIESGRIELSENPVYLFDMVDNVTTMSQSLAVAKSIDFTVTLENIENPYVYLDELHINEVMINLISNAIKYTPAGGKVLFTINQLREVAHGKASFRFTIADSGIGMSEEFQEHLFEPFSREQNTTVSKLEGTGLGLSIVKKIVDLTHGSITVQSKVGEGSVFNVELSFRVMEERDIINYTQEREETASTGEDLTLEGKKVLLVEDNEMNREIATDILMEVGLEIETAEDGDIAVKMVTEKGVDYYDFVLMDIQMPVMNGYDATKAIRRLPNSEHLPIIALSANAFKEDKERSLASGMNEHIAKPIDIKMLFAAMHRLAK